MILTFNEAIKPENVIVQVEYGSTVYGTANELSDTDYIVVVKDGIECDDQYKRSDGDYSFFSKSQFQQLLDDQFIGAIEAYFTDPSLIHQGSFKDFTYKVNLAKLREECSKRASNSYVKCKKKLIDGEIRIGLKSLFHSLRILDFGIQIATHGKIVNYQSCNHHLDLICQIDNDWEWLNEEFKPIYNHLSSQFRLVAPK